jgi:phosphoglycolate phosphatase-like HAD superfamily hydrolase
METIQAAIFDIDGTLLDSNDAHARAFKQAFKEVKKFYSYLKIRRLIGMGGDHLIPVLSGISENSPEGKKVAQRKKEIFFSHYLAHLKPFQQGKELVETLLEHGLKVAIATSAEASELEQFLKIIGLKKTMLTITSDCN